MLALKEQQLAEKDHQIADKDNQLAEKERQIAGKDQQLADKDDQLAEKDQQGIDKDRQLAEKDTIVAEKEKQLCELQAEFKKFQQEFMESTKVALDRFLGIIDYEFTLSNFSSCQKQGTYGDWFSDPFCVSGVELKLNVETKQKWPIMNVRLYTKSDTEITWSVTIIVTLQLLNQRNDVNHFSKKMIMKLEAGNYCSGPYEYIPFLELYRPEDKTVQYLIQDTLKFRMWIEVSK